MQDASTKIWKKIFEVEPRENPESKQFRPS